MTDGKGLIPFQQAVLHSCKSCDRKRRGNSSQSQCNIAFYEQTRYLHDAPMAAADFGCKVVFVLEPRQQTNVPCFSSFSRFMYYDDEANLPWFKRCNRSVGACIFCVPCTAATLSQRPLFLRSHNCLTGHLLSFFSLLKSWQFQFLKVIEFLVVTMNSKRTCPVLKLFETRRCASWRGS